MTYHVTSSVHVEHPPSINLVISAKLAVYNSEIFKPNGLASPFRRKDLSTFKSSHSASLMAQSPACCSPCQYPHDGEDELIGGTRNERNNRRTTAPAATYALTPVVASVISLLVASGSADSSMVRYLEDDLQRIIRTVLDSKPPAPVPAPVVAAAPHYEGTRKRSLKARFLDVY